LFIFAGKNYKLPAMSTQMMAQQIAEYFKTQPVLKAWLFGSYARGEETPESDVDILVVLDHSQPVGLKFFGMYEDLKELLGRPVDLVVDRSLASFARESVERDKLLIYERAA
jgi:predicted nucleotidyltransferase